MSNRIRQITSLTTAIGSVEEGILTRFCSWARRRRESFDENGKKKNKIKTRDPETGVRVPLQARGHHHHTSTACVTINTTRKWAGDKWDSPRRGRLLFARVLTACVYAVYTILLTGLSCLPHFIYSRQHRDETNFGRPTNIFDNNERP